MGMHRAIVVGYRLAAAGLGIAAMITQVLQGGSTANFFSFFTIQSNIIAAAVFIWSSFGTPPDWVRGANTTYMSITGIVYAVLLSGLPAAADSSLHWVNLSLHRIIPLVVVLDWLLVPPTGRLRFGPALTWLLYPLAYGIYSLIRGAIVHWYPYPFLSVTIHGYARVTLNCVVFAIAAAVLVWIVVLLGNLLRTRRAGTPMLA